MILPSTPIESKLLRGFGVSSFFGEKPSQISAFDVFDNRRQIGTCLVNFLGSLNPREHKNLVTKVEKSISRVRSKKLHSLAIFGHFRPFSALWISHISYLGPVSYVQFVNSSAWYFKRMEDERRRSYY